MKIKILVVVIAIAGLSACTQKTCPTYAKKDVDSKNVEMVKV